MKILHLHFFNFAFKFPAKNSEFFRFKYLNFPPTFLDSIGAEEAEEAEAEHGDNRGTSSFGHSALNQYCSTGGRPLVVR